MKKKIISVILTLVTLFSTCSTAFAEKMSYDNVGVIPTETAHKNAEVFSEFYDTLDEDIGYGLSVKYDSQQRISAFVVSDGEKTKTYEVIYDGDGFSFGNAVIGPMNDDDVVHAEIDPNGETSAVLNSGADAGINSDIAVLSDVTTGDCDDKMIECDVKKRIREAQMAWLKEPKLREVANMEANIARADYCVVYPKSSFADAFLEIGTLKTGTKFRRTLKSGMSGRDVIALQRALMAWGMLGETDIPTMEYGSFGPLTKAGVEEFQSKNGLTVDGIVGVNTIKKVFSANKQSNIGLISLEGLNKINVFRERHNWVCNNVSAYMRNTKRYTIINEAYIAKAGIRNAGGRADIVKVESKNNRVWEVKPDSRYGHLTGPIQLANYVVKSKLPENADRYYCPMTQGEDIDNVSITWQKETDIIAYSSKKFTEKGVIFYKEQKKNKKEWQRESVFTQVPVTKEEREKEYATVSWPDAKLVYESMFAAGIIVAGIYVSKAVLGGVFAVPSGGTSLFLLCF